MWGVGLCGAWVLYGEPGGSILYTEISRKANFRGRSLRAHWRTAGDRSAGAARCITVTSHYLLTGWQRQPDAPPGGRRGV